MHVHRQGLTTLFLALSLAACGSSGSGSMPTAPPGNPGNPPGPSPTTATIAATPQLAFTPNAVTIGPGGVVTFAFGSVGHSVKFDTGPNPPSDITGVNANTSISRTFNTTGTFTFHCTIHPSMTGSITVAAAGTAPAPTPPPPPPGNYP